MKWQKQVYKGAQMKKKTEVNAQYRYTNIYRSNLCGVITAKFAEQGDMASPILGDHRIAFCFTSASFGFGTRYTLIKQRMSGKVVVKIPTK